MRHQNWKPLPELRKPSMRRVLEGMRRLDNELVCWEEQESAIKPMTGELSPSKASRFSRGRANVTIDVWLVPLNGLGARRCHDGGQ